MLIDIQDRIAVMVARDYEKIGAVWDCKYLQFKDLLPPGTIAYDDGQSFNNPKYPDLDKIAIYKVIGTTPDISLFWEKCKIC